MSTPFERTWSAQPGFFGWLAVVNNQPLGLRFMVTALGFFVVGGVLALLMRIQLAIPGNTFLGPQTYNEFFTMHGSTMMYLFAVPFLEGLALYLLPLIIGSRDVAFPRLTALSYWTYLFGGLIFYASFFFNAAPDAGWFSYTPLSGPKYAGAGVDFWLLGLSLVEIAGLAAGVEIVVSVLKLRAPGMSISRMPLFAWAMLVTGVMMIFAFTPLLMATVLLELDRSAGTRFFDAEHGGSSLLWQHLFWFFGHPEVYIIFIPATGIVSMIVTAFAQRPVVGYILIAVAIVLTAFVSFGLWVHHMFATGLPHLAMSFFTAASLMIGVASGTQVFAWIATLWGTRPEFRTPLRFIYGFLFLFVLGGLTGVMVAVVPFDLQVHDTYFIVAHFHYVLIGGAIFPVFAGWFYWLPKITGRMLSEPLGRWSFWLMFLGFNLTFFPMHIMGFLGMPRRVYTYPPDLGLTVHNLVATGGAFVFAAGFLVFLAAVARSFRTGSSAGPNPWKADSLEWSVPSPPPIYSFLKPPSVQARHPLWNVQPKEPDNPIIARAREALNGSPENWRATLSTDPLTGEPQAVQYLAGNSLLPLLVALGLVVAAVGVIAKLHLLAPLGGLFTVIVLLYWLVPNPKVVAQITHSDVGQRAGLPVLTTGPRSTAWWGMLSLLAILGTAFGAVVFSYFYIRLFSADWPQQDLPRPRITTPLLALGLLAISSATLFGATITFRRGHRRLPAGALIAVLLLGAVFIGWQIAELSDQPFHWRTNAYGSLFFLLHWFLQAVLLSGLVIVGAAAVRLAPGVDPSDTSAALQLQLASMYWHFAVATGVAAIAIAHLSPHLMGK